MQRILHLQVLKQAPRVNLLIHLRRQMFLSRKARSTQESIQIMLSVLIQNVVRREALTLAPSLTHRAVLTGMRLDSLLDLILWMIDETITGVAASTTTIMVGHLTSPWATAEIWAVLTGNIHPGRRWTNRSVVPPIGKAVSRSQTGPIGPGVSVLMREMACPEHDLAHHHTPIVQG